MQSTMQSSQLGIPLLLRHIRNITGRSRIYTPGNPQGVPFRTLYANAARLANALREMGLSRGTVIGTFCSNHIEHLQTYLAIPGAGFILHTINVRLSDAQIEKVIQDGGDEIIFCDAALLEQLTRISQKCPNVRALISIGQVPAAQQKTDTAQTIRYEDLVANGVDDFDWPEITETDAAIICHTGGTTGDPKGIAYSHRSLWLQALSLCTANSMGISGNTRLLPAVPLYHVNGWGLPYAAFLAGADIVLPDKSLHSAEILKLIDQFKPDVAAGVPTIWLDVMDHLHKAGRHQLGTVKEIASGGATVPPTLIKAYEEMGIHMYQAWGMTETSSMSAVGRLMPGMDPAHPHGDACIKLGRLAAGLELRIMGEDGKADSSGGIQSGEIEIRGPWVTRSYLGNVGSENFHDGWLRTGDLGTVDEDGCVAITDRLKDAIKSGGEWISSIDLERVIREHPAIHDVAVVSIPDKKWQERPAAVIVLNPEFEGAQPDMSAWLCGRVAKWWIPSVWLTTDQLPRTSVGKVNKKLIRQMIHDGKLNQETPGEPSIPSPT